MVSMLYVTFASKSDAVMVAEKLLAENLIACANILEGSTSIYRWKGKTERQQEVILLAKTTSEKVEKSMRRVKELHGYDLPCVLSFNADTGLPEFMDWVAGEVVRYE
ncbi:MAG: divalent-cation tolerance protein CutA [Rickettsiales bacterium]